MILKLKRSAYLCCLSAILGVYGVQVSASDQMGGITEKQIKEAVTNHTSSKFCIVRARERIISHGLFEPTFLQLVTLTCDGQETLLYGESDKQKILLTELLTIAGRYFTESGFSVQCYDKETCSFQNNLACTGK